MLQLGIRIAIELRKYSEALELIEKGLQRGGLEVSSFTKQARALAVAVGGSANADIQIARRALDLALQREPDDVDALILRGRVRLQIAGTANYEGTAAAADDFARAVTQALAQKKDNPELRVVQIELAEARFMAGQHAAAAKAALDFLEVAPDTISGIDSYRPVAHLIKAASDQLRGVRGVQDRLRGDIAGFTSWPELFVEVPGGKGKASRIRVAQWSFNVFDDFVCRKTEGAQRAALIDLSAMVQTKVMVDDPKAGRTVRDCEAAQKEREDLNPGRKTERSPARLIAGKKTARGADRLIAGRTGGAQLIRANPAAQTPTR